MEEKTRLQNSVCIRCAVPFISNILLTGAYVQAVASADLVCDKGGQLSQTHQHLKLFSCIRTYIQCFNNERYLGGRLNIGGALSCLPHQRITFVLFRYSLSLSLSYVL